MQRCTKKSKGPANMKGNIKCFDLINVFKSKKIYSTGKLYT